MLASVEVDARIEESGAVVTSVYRALVWVEQLLEAWAVGSVTAAFAVAFAVTPVADKITRSSRGGVGS